MYDNEHPNRWLISYADFITLLFAFFVVMYAISSINQQKYYALNSSLNAAFSNKSQVLTKNLVGNKPPMEERLSEAEMVAIADAMARQLSPFIMDGKVRVIQNKQELRVDIHESLLFESGNTKLSYDAIAILGKVAQVLSTQNNRVVIEAHTDNVPVNDPQYASNWSFSAARASKIVEALNETGIAANRLNASGSAASHPIEENTSPLGRARNRRISIVIPILSFQPPGSYTEISPNGLD